MFRAIAGGPSGRLSAAAYSLAAKRSPVATLSPLLRNPIIHHHHHNPLPLYATSSLSPFPPSPDLLSFPPPPLISHFNSIPLGIILTSHIRNGQARGFSTAPLFRAVGSGIGRTFARLGTAAIVGTTGGLGFFAALQNYFGTILFQFSFNSPLCSSVPLFYVASLLVPPLLSVPPSLPRFFSRGKRGGERANFPPFFSKFFFFFHTTFFYFPIALVDINCAKQEP